MTRIARYRDRATGDAALIAAVISARFELDDPLSAFRARHDDQLHDLLHSFAFNARKMIELARSISPQVSALANQEGITGFTIQARQIGQSKSYSFLFVLNRIIHSDALVISRADVLIGPEEADISHQLPFAILVQSDWDTRRDERHFVTLQGLLERFITIDEALKPHLS